jgi:hypothetical protein
MKNPFRQEFAKRERQTLTDKNNLVVWIIFQYVLCDIRKSLQANFLRDFDKHVGCLLYCHLLFCHDASARGGRGAQCRSRQLG